MGANGSQRGEAPSSSSSAGAVPPRVVPQTPESVKDLGPEVCYDVGAFRGETLECVLSRAYPCSLR